MHRIVFLIILIMYSSAVRCTSVSLSPPLKEIILNTEEAKALGFIAIIDNTKPYDELNELEVFFQPKVNGLQFFIARAALKSDTVVITSNRVTNAKILNKSRVFVPLNRAYVTSVELSFIYGKTIKYIIEYDLNRI